MLSINNDNFRDDTNIIIVKDNENWEREVKVTPSMFPTLPIVTIQKIPTFNSREKH